MKLQDFKIGCIYYLKGIDTRGWEVICIVTGIQEGSIWLDDLLIIKDPEHTELQKEWHISESALDSYASYTLLGTKEELPEYFL